ncbi:tRNA pseudouridine(13) synthase TruD [Bermanella marisrubri]|uniref:tRNA pseudouridine synthase D n=1 Tax=Bermanella marisrubri TaxID=207949 RepID=Q1N1K5_9GAMM|nr:tRNA pseudouridine(13) synthase TruD [Bermanella marisrubri]EAT12045.1 Pseudouridylate synthase [Oceanobacter sp. RED65] [Bermanella marisrubri]QIZ83518.1 tRNA pseudouridine(13) synthase TruD [Bermanella marisrubri]
MDYAKIANQWPLAYSPLDITAQYRVEAEDFQVTELSNRILKEEGPHWYLFIEKTDTNTQWLARQIANHAQIDLRDVGYAGLKDRHAITRQWFSIPVEKRQPDLTALFEREEFTLIDQGYYGVKLKRGNLGGNHFKLRLRNVQGSKAELEQRLTMIKDQGVPNYFGGQRFGHDYDNIVQAERLFVSGKRPRNRQKASLFTSAARSFLFNEMLAHRVQGNVWQRPIKGDVFGFSGSLRGFIADGTAAESQRWRNQNIHPTCAMWGRGNSLSEADLADIEGQIAQKYEVLSQGLEKQGLKQERRTTRMLLPDLAWTWQDDETLVLEFSLGSGYFATSLLRELGQIDDASKV